MKGLIEAARRLAAARAETVTDALVETAAEELDGIAARRAPDGIVLSGRALARRLAFVAPIALLVAALKARK